MIQLDLYGGHGDGASEAPVVAVQPWVRAPLARRSLHRVPITLKQANRYIKKNHRHHGPVEGCCFCIGAAVAGRICGVAIVGRPVSRHLDNGLTAEVTRLCTDGQSNAASMLLAACARAAREIGYTSIITYILDTETGVSLLAAGWKNECVTDGGSWDRESRPREDKASTDPKLRWRKAL